MEGNPPPAEQDDVSLALLAAAGDDGAFSLLMARHRSSVVRFVFRMLDDATEAQDVAQTTFVRAYRALRSRSFRRTDAHFPTWLFRIARNAALDVLRHRQRHPAVSMSLLLEQGRDVADSRRSADALAGDAETGAQVAAAVARLPEEQRAAFVLCEYEGIAQDEIARILKCSVRAVESRLFRARQSLRKDLALFFDEL